jgi:hypothetical protein
VWPGTAGQERPRARRRAVECRRRARRGCWPPWAWTWTSCTSPARRCSWPRPSMAWTRSRPARCPRRGLGRSDPGGRRRERTGDGPPPGVRPEWDATAGCFRTVLPGALPGMVEVVVPRRMSPAGWSRGGPSRLSPMTVWTDWPVDRPVWSVQAGCAEVTEHAPGSGHGRGGDDRLGLTEGIKDIRCWNVWYPRYGWMKDGER